MKQDSDNDRETHHPDGTGVLVQNRWRRAVVSKFHGATNSSGARISVRPADTGQAMFFGWDYSCGPQENHEAAIEAFLVEQGWRGVWTMGATKDGYVAVFTNRAIGDFPWPTPDELPVE